MRPMATCSLGHNINAVLDIGKSDDRSNLEGIDQIHIF